MGVNVRGGWRAFSLTLWVAAVLRDAPQASPSHRDGLEAANGHNHNRRLWWSQHQNPAISHPTRLVRRLLGGDLQVVMHHRLVVRCSAVGAKATGIGRRSSRESLGAVLVMDAAWALRQPRVDRRVIRRQAGHFNAEAETLHHSSADCSRCHCKTKDLSPLHLEVANDRRGPCGLV